jgi:hypothetical protein
MDAREMCMRSNSALWLVVAGVGLAACGSVSQSNDAGGGNGGGGAGGGAGTGGAGPPTVAQACGQYATTLCGRLDGCAPYALQIFYGDRATCESRVLLSCMRDLEVPDTNQTTTDMAACARDANNSSCPDLLANVFPASCQIKPGKRLNGEGCGSSWQCLSTHCEKPSGDCGVCAPRASAAGACTVDGGCTAGLVCAALKCVAPAAQGAPCSAMAPCRANLYCSTATNTCATPLPLGASCMGDTNGCDFRQGVSCNSFASPPKCEMIAAAKGGQACGIVNNTLTICVALNTCQGISLVPLQTSGVCPNPAGDGMQCTDTVHCLAPASCVGGLCRLPSTSSCAK